MHLFSASPELIDFASGAYQRRSADTSSLLRQLFEQLRGEGFTMTYTMEDFRRDFASGIVLVNPNTGSFTINLGATYKLLNGTTATTVTLGPNTGLVLVKV